MKKVDKYQLTQIFASYNKAPVKVGDTVVVPAPWFLQDIGPTTTGKVKQLGSEYSGHVISVISVK